jgi:hypothetical protein
MILLLVGQGDLLSTADIDIDKWQPLNTRKCANGSHESHMGGI